MTQTYDEWFNTELNKLGDWEWTVNDAGEKVDAVLKNVEEFDEVVIKRTIDFFDKIDAPMLKEGNVQKLYNAGHKTIESIINASCDELVDILGENGNKVFNGLDDKLTDIQLYQIMGAYSNERGIGVKRLKKLQKALGSCDALFQCDDPTIIANVAGFDTKTAKQTVIVISKFINFFNKICDSMSLAEDVSTDSTLAGEKVCMTGFRDKELAAKIESLGGDVQSGVSGKTTILVAKDPNSTSGKIKKARDAGIKIMGIDEFKNYIGDN